MATSRTSSSSAGAKKARPTVADDVQDAFIKPLKGMADRLQNLPLAGAASTIVESGRKDLAALMEANEKSYQGLQAVVQRQTEMLKASIVEWQGAVKGMSPAEPRENLAKLDALGRAAFKQALDDIRELSELAARSQAEAFDIVSQRIRSNVDEVSKLLKTPRK
ncbi:TIGR01841 family phasin [Variovorax sp. JS1663]|uniref:TIGR01841 family phasin n=1 Tax=Variovorax sp. JS1663 TaxID=1851577 RepID=UPI000B3478D6|nr:TIGR01841 family phasin [Variovorax sp. JS1663]OUM01512.1 phasin [Variovorax sp. JS1663]